MKIKELIEELNRLPPDSELILQTDSEGNGYIPLSGVDGDCIYDDGEVYSTKWTAVECCMTQQQYKELLKKQRCAVLYPY